MHERGQITGFGLIERMRDADEAFNEITLWEESEGGNATVREGA